MTVAVLIPELRDLSQTLSTIRAQQHEAPAMDHGELGSICTLHGHARHQARVAFRFETGHQSCADAWDVISLAWRGDVERTA